MMLYRVTLEAEVETYEAAKKLLSDLEEVVGKANAELIDSDMVEEE
jgi:hypothetical protein